MTSLARNPLSVVAVTLAISVAVTGVLLLFGLDMDAVAIVTTLATVWGVDLALVIYLLTARDTDKLLAHIDALQDQLSAALEAPGAGAEVIDAAAPVPPPQAADVPSVPSVPDAESPADQPTGAPATPPSALAGRIPDEYLAALLQHAGLDAAGIRRAWTPHPRGNGPWVVEDDQGGRWSVFQARGGRPSVIPLGTRQQLRADRDEVTQRLRAERLAAWADRRTDAHASRNNDDASGIR